MIRLIFNFISKRKFKNALESNQIVNFNCKINNFIYKFQLFLQTDIVVFVNWNYQAKTEILDVSERMNDKEAFLKCE